MKALLLLSGGLDSVSNLFLAVEDGIDISKTITFDYGQKASKKEIETAIYFSQKFKIPHETIDVSHFFRLLGKSSLINRGDKIPQKDEVEIDNFQKCLSTAKSVWVPNRNGVFLSMAAAIAEARNIPLIIPGFNFEEALTFPDNSEEFLYAFNRALNFSTQAKVQAKSWTIQWTKSQIIEKVKKFPLMEFDKLWPCYLDLEEWCNECESCQRFLRAYENQIY